MPRSRTTSTCLRSFDRARLGFPSSKGAKQGSLSRSRAREITMLATSFFKSSRRHGRRMGNLTLNKRLLTARVDVFVPTPPTCGRIKTDNGALGASVAGEAQSLGSAPQRDLPAQAAGMAAEETHLSSGVAFPRCQAFPDHFGGLQSTPSRRQEKAGNNSARKLDVIRNSRYLHIIPVKVRLLKHLRCSVRPMCGASRPVPVTTIALGKSLKVQLACSVSARTGRLS